MREIQAFPPCVSHLEESCLLLYHGAAGDEMPHRPRLRQREAAQVEAAIVLVESEIIERKPALESLEDSRRARGASASAPASSERLPRLGH